MVGSTSGTARFTAGLVALALLMSCGCSEPQRVFRDVKAGARLRVPSESGLVYQVAAVPGGSRACELVALGADGAVLARDRSSGPLGLPRLTAPAGAHALRIEPVA